MSGQKPASDIPVGTQFSPDLIDLQSFLTAVLRHSGDKKAMEEAVWAPAVRTKSVSRKPTRRQRSLPLEAAVQYGLLEPETYEVTELARRLAELGGEDLREEFGRHILLRCGGLRVVEGIRQMRADHLKVTGDTLARFLTSQGFVVTEHNTAINTLRMWLAEAGVFPEGRSRAWEVNDGAVEDLLGLPDASLQVLSGLTRGQRAFVEGLCTLAPKGWYPAAEVRDWAEAMRGVKIGRGSLPKEILEDLRSAGIIEFQTGGTAGGKTSKLRTTDLFDREVLEPFVTRTLEDLDPIVRGYYRERPEDIFEALESKSKNERGAALEALAIYVMRLLGLRFVEWRRRAKSTGYAEVDALLAGAVGALPTRWQVQCKHTPRSAVSLEDVAKEVGLVPITGATHILFLTTGRFTEDARRYALEVMKRSPLTLFLLDGDEVTRIRKQPGSLATLLRSQSRRLIDEGIGGGSFEWT